MGYINRSDNATDVGFNGVPVWLSWCLAVLTRTATSSRCAGANRVGTADRGVRIITRVTADTGSNKNEEMYVNKCEFAPEQQNILLC